MSKLTFALLCVLFLATVSAEDTFLAEKAPLLGNFAASTVNLLDQEISGTWILGVDDYNNNFDATTGVQDDFNNIGGLDAENLNVDLGATRNGTHHTGKNHPALVGTDPIFRENDGEEETYSIVVDGSVFSGDSDGNDISDYVNEDIESFNGVGNLGGQAAKEESKEKIHKHNQDQKHE